MTRRRDLEPEPKPERGEPPPRPACPDVACAECERPGCPCPTCAQIIRSAFQHLDALGEKIAARLRVTEARQEQRHAVQRCADCARGKFAHQGVTYCLRCYQRLGVADAPDFPRAPIRGPISSEEIPL